MTLKNYNLNQIILLDGCVVDFYHLKAEILPANLCFQTYKIAVQLITLMVISMKEKRMNLHWHMVK